MGRAYHRFLPYSLTARPAPLLRVTGVTASTGLHSACGVGPLVAAYPTGAPSLGIEPSKVGFGGQPVPSTKDQKCYGQVLQPIGVHPFSFPACERLTRFELAPSAWKAEVLTANTTVALPLDSSSTEGHHNPSSPTRSVDNLARHRSRVQDGQSFKRTTRRSRTCTHVPCPFCLYRWARVVCACRVTRGFCFRR